jgi:hypothetical protein
MPYVFGADIAFVVKMKRIKQKTNPKPVACNLLLFIIFTLLFRI